MTTHRRASHTCRTAGKRPHSSTLSCGGPTWRPQSQGNTGAGTDVHHDQAGLSLFDKHTFSLEETTDDQQSLWDIAYQGAAHVCGWACIEAVRFRSELCLTRGDLLVQIRRAQSRDKVTNEQRPPWPQALVATLQVATNADERPQPGLPGLPGVTRQPLYIPHTPSTLLLPKHPWKVWQVWTAWACLNDHGRRAHTAAAVLCSSPAHLSATTANVACLLC